MPVPRLLQLRETWYVGARVGEGHAGNVHLVTNRAGVERVAKLVPKGPGAGRSLPCLDLRDVPHVVPVLDEGDADGYHVLLMPRATRTLREHLKAHGRLPEDQVLPVLRDVAETLEALASRDDPIVHRDVKPGNILLLGGHWCLADFGITRSVDAATGRVVRTYWTTPQYAAPERWRNEAASPATDVYSLAVVAYKLLAGKLPFGGPDYGSQHLHDVPSRIGDVSPDLWSLVADGLQKSRRKRPSASDVLRRLELMEQRRALGATALR